MANTLAMILLLLLTLAGGCEDSKQAEPRFSIADVLDMDGIANNNSTVGGNGFSSADRVIAFQFPRDHGSHPSYRNEWWYVTGNVVDDRGRYYGYQLTFFRIGLRPPSQHQALKSNWAHDNIWMAHVALSDQSRDTHLQQERFSRGNPGMAGSQITPFKVWLDDWQLLSKDNAFPWQLSVTSEAFSLALTLNSTKPMVLQGIDGLSQKSPTPGNASYYYSYSRLRTSGSIQIAEESFSVTGLSWFDREWSSRILDADQIGWDWFSLQFDDGTELMYYQIRSRNDQTHASGQGKFINSKGVAISITADDIKLKPLRYWQDDYGTRYPIAWQIDYNNQQWIIRPLIDDQLMQTAVKYWEGAVEVLPMGDKQPIIGRGYLELTGY